MSIDKSQSPEYLEVMWPDGEFEYLYSDEVNFIDSRELGKEL